MPYVAAAQLARALESLTKFHPFFGVTFLSMKQTGVNTTTATAWGNAQEAALLNSAFRPSGAPAGKLYYVPFGRPEEDTGFWRNPKYAGGSLQSARTRQRFSEALVRVASDQWKFGPDYVQRLAALLPKDGAVTKKLPVFDLAAWLYREQDLPGTLAEVEQKFRTDFNVSDAAEYAGLFDSTAPDPNHFYSPDPIDREDLVALVQGIPEGPSMGTRTEADLIAHVESWMQTSANLTLPAGFVRRFYTALKAQRFVILAGRPGTGKTAFVRAFHGALEDFFAGTAQLVEISIGPEFSESDVIGYERLTGGIAATELSRRLFLSGRPNDLYVVLLDEMNLAEVDHYLARLLPALESDASVELPGTSSSSKLPADALVVGTVNSFIEEATRKPLSGPVKRRANIIEMPNHLANLVNADDRSGFNKACSGLLKQARDRIAVRQKSGSQSVLDAFRVEALTRAIAPASPLSEATFTDAIWTVCKVCCAEASTAPTFGVVQDVLEYVAMSSADVHASLGEQLAQKIVPQLNGPAHVARELLTAVQTLDAGSGKFSASIAALEVLLQHEDIASGTVTFPY